MLHLRYRITAVLIFGYLTIATSAFGSDFIIKYYIYSMETEEDRSKIVEFIMQHDGVQKVETKLDRHWVYIYLEDEILEDERFDIRVPLRDRGYPVDRWEVQLEKPDGHD